MGEGQNWVARVGCRWQYGRSTGSTSQAGGVSDNPKKFETMDMTTRRTSAARRVKFDLRFRVVPETQVLAGSVRSTQV